MADTITTEEDTDSAEAELEEPMAEDLEAGDWDELDETEEVDSDEEADSEEDDDSSEGDSGEAALDELEAEELEMLTEDEAEETLVIDEAAELRAIRRAEIALDASEGAERLNDEFQCQSCFLVKKTAQLADKRRQFCRDCT